MTSKLVTIKIHREGSMCFIPVTFDPKAVFGKIRAPVKVTLNGCKYRSTIAAMGGVKCIPLRKSNREAAGLDGTETLTVRIELDTEAREVSIPPDLREALARHPSAAERWSSLSYSDRRERVEAIESAKKPETRARRVSSDIAMLVAPSTQRPKRSRSGA